MSWPPLDTALVLADQRIESPCRSRRIALGTEEISSAAGIRFDFSDIQQYIGGEVRVTVLLCDGEDEHRVAGVQVWFASTVFVGFSNLQDRRLWPEIELECGSPLARHTGPSYTLLAGLTENVRIVAEGGE